MQKADKPRKKRARKQTSDDRARDATLLTASTEHGCEMFRKKVLCGNPIFVILSGPLGSTAICIECWQRAMDIAAEAHVDMQDLRAKYRELLERESEQLMAG